MNDLFARTPIAHEPVSVVLLPGGGVADAETIVASWITCLTSLTKAFELLLVDDGRAEVAGPPAGQDSRLRLVRLPDRPGVGVCIRAALAEARYPLFAYAACDPAYAPSEFKLLLEQIDKVDVVSGYRAGKKSLSVRGYGWLARAVFGVRLRDPSCPFKLFRRSIFARIPIQSDGDFVHAEIIAKANFLGCLLLDVPITGPERIPAPAWRTVLSDAQRVFHRPDFGPPFLPQSEQPAQAASTGES